VNVSTSEKKIKVLKEKRDELVVEYNRIMLVLSGVQDQIADVDGDIRMLQDGQKKRPA
tara:strand:+ start:485 stop:658 length:174 start_codon:yes stop_codon:yes gene_type:complete